MSTDILVHAAQAFAVVTGVLLAIGVGALAVVIWAMCCVVRGLLARDPTEPR